MAMDMGFESKSSAEVDLAVSEIAQNAIRYGQGGTVVLTKSGFGKILNATIKDNGPGINNIDQAVKNGYSTKKNSLGIGLDVARKSVDELIIDSDANHGTTVELNKFLPLLDTQIDYGVVSVCDERYAINGDDYFIKEYDGDKVLCGVLDGTGEGYSAHVAATLVKDYINEHYRKSLDEIAIECHRILEESDIDRGSTLSMARISKHETEYLGIGDTHAYILGKELHQLLNHDGTVGLFQLPTLKVRKYPLKIGDYIIFCTDGIKSNITVDGYSGNRAQELSNYIFNQFHRSYGDVTVLVVKYLSKL